MTEALHTLLLWINAHPTWALWVLFGLTLLDSLFIVGAFIPAALPLFAIGALVALDALELWPTLLIACAGALLGDSISFWLGRRYGDRLFSARFFQRHPDLVGNGRRFFQKHGPYSILLARFLGPLRAVTPSLAAASGMRFWLFACADVVGAFIWACAFIMPGVAFGASLGLAAEVAGRLASLLLGLMVVMWLTFWLATAITRVVGRLASRWLPPLLEWSRNRYPLGRYGLALIDHELPETPALSVLAVLLLLFAATLLYLTAGHHLHHYPLRLDATIFQWMRDVHTPLGFSLARRLLQIGEWRVYVPVGVVTFVMLMALRKPRAAAHWAAALAFGGAIALGLYGIPLLAPPSHYFATTLPDAAHGRDLVLATVTYSFLPVLLSTASTPVPRSALYASSALLLVLVVFAQLYLGVLWFSVAVLLVLFGLAWTALLGLGYRWHRPEKLPAAPLIITVSVSFFIALSLQWRQLPATEARTPVAVQTLSLAQWQDPRALQRFPLQRQDAAGRPQQPFTLQWAGDLPAIRARLLASGWQTPAPLTLGQMLHWLTSSAAIADLPVMPQVNVGEHPALVLRFPVDDQHQYYLRLWPSRFRLDDGRPIWIGNVMLQEARSFHRVLRYPVAVDFDPPLAPLLAGLVDTQHRVNGPVWLLW
jgi:undecaprenyl-diphosphatase